MDRTATGAVALQTERRCSRSTRETAEREQKGSAARSAQQMSARRAAPCPKAMTPARYAKKQDARILPPDRQPAQLHPKQFLPAVRPAPAGLVQLVSRQADQTAVARLASRVASPRTTIPPPDNTAHREYKANAPG